ncbi:site-specific DNA-methyltransferase [Rhodovulum sulfidophilum]|uniref:site-specific DNA-methyltransferase n=1 Tax=Rhodovulum sulfidophilum TaxID=35806 RepID=UPI0013897A9B|nr:site-specific DNA-methyltransferase [Rhodovulum sulfidophilum]NDK36825.1 site-specific DNA-methyltransferase [Rhodovulum sulfidophilum]
MPLLNWLTRDEDLKAADRVPYRLLDEVPELSRGEGAEGLLVQGDNLEALKALLPFYAGRVKCIYIDPPYNTRSAFEHYDDSLEHAKWLAMIVPRLMLLREFLTEDGSIWVSIDDNEGHYLKVVIDEVFGRRNFLATVIWQKIHARNNTARHFSDDHDFKLVYAKNAELWVPNKVSRTSASDSDFWNPDNDPRGRWRRSDMTASKPYNDGNYEVVGPHGDKFTPRANRYWGLSRETFEELRKDDRIWWGKTGRTFPFRKRFESELGGLTPTTVWEHEAVGNNREAKQEITKIFGRDGQFATPKPERLLQRILHISTNPGDLVLDSFLGSGTTAAVAHKMGRRWIGIEMGEHARTHCALRLEKVIEGEQGGISKDVDWQGGGGFRFCRLGKAVYDAQGRIDDSIRFADLARHVWFSETRQPLTDPPESPVLGVHEGRAVALLFNGILKDRTPRGGNVLTRPVLRLIREALPEEFDGDLVVYGTACRLSAETLKHEGILFRQTPYDLAVRV